MLTIYLTRQMIQAVVDSGGKTITVERVCSAPMPIGLLNGGVVADEEKMTQFLADFWKENNLPKKDVVLTVYSGQMATKLVDTPILKPPAMIDFLQPEFSDVNRHEDPVYSYWVAQQDKKHKRCKVFATLAERSFLKQYIDLFAKIGVKLKEIASPLCGVLALVSELPVLCEKTAVLQIWDGTSLSNILLINGIYTYSNNTQMFQEPGTPGFSVEVARQVSRLKQFMKAQQIEEKLSHVYLIGVSADDFGYCEEGIYQVDPDILVCELDDKMIGRVAKIKNNIDITPVFFPFAAQLLDEDYVGLLAQYGVDPEKLKDRQEMKRRLRPVAALAGVFALAVAILGGYHLYLSHHLNQLNEFNTSPEVVAAVAEYDQLAKDNQKMKNKMTELENDERALKSYPLANSKINTVLDNSRGGYVDLEVSSYDAETGIFRVDTSASQVTQINAYIAVLRTTGLFYDVSYTGYTFNTTTQKWSVNVVCTLAEDAGR